MQKQKHIPVLEKEVLTILQPKEKDTYLDLTAGYGGHASQVLENIGRQGSAILVDRDETAIRHLKELFGQDRRVNLVHSDFLSASQALVQTDQRFDMIFADLGVSSPHLDIAERGFSFQEDGPLDMRMDPRTVKTAADIINNADPRELVDILRHYGEVRGAARLVGLIVENRPFSSTTEFAKLISRAYPGYHKVHPATRVFQALRIAVNQELDQLEASLPLWIQLLKPGGRLAIISFHSLEDRWVKQFFQAHGVHQYDATLHILTKRPIVASQPEIVHNPRARSAKLRAAVKIKT
jgi:16S rRNA (cytosine1402-N4)-methyltransferase